jgi:iron(III) transport system permease protein
MSHKKHGQKRVMDPISITFTLVIIASLFVFNVLPLIKILIESFRDADGTSFSFMGYIRAFQLKQNREAIWHTLVSSTLASLLSTLLGFLFAYCSCYLKMRLKKLFDFVALLPIISPPFAMSLSTILLFGNKGLISKTLLGIQNSNIYGFWGLLFAQTFSFFPMAYLALKGVLASIDPSIEEAARDMGTSRWKTFTKVTLPLALPGIGNAFLVVFIKCVADFGNPNFIGGDYLTMATQIYYRAPGGYEMQRCCALAMLLLVMTLIIYLISQMLLTKRTFVTITGKATRERTPITEKHITIPLNVACGAVTALVLLMYFMIPYVSFTKVWGVNNSFTLDSYKYAWRVGDDALIDTLKLALITTPVTGLLSMLMSFLIVRKKSKVTGLMNTLGMMGMIIPGTILGFAYVLQFNSGLIVLTGSIILMVASCCSRYLPLGLSSGITSLRQIDPSIEESAADLGANSLKVFIKVTVPLIRSAFFGGLVYSFVRTMTSMSALIFFVSPKHQLLTTTIMRFVADGRYSAACAMGTMMVVVVLICIAGLYGIIGLFGVNRKEVKLL